MIPVNGTFSADGESSVIKVGGAIHFHGDGNFGGGQISVEYLASDGSYRTVTNTEQTADFDKEIRFKQPSRVKVVLSGSTSPSLFWEIR